MMSSKVEAGKKAGEDSGNRKLLNEIEAISKALYRDVKPSKNSSSTSSVFQSKSSGKSHLPDPKSKLKNTFVDPTNKDKKSIWSWKSLKGFSHIRNRRFNCCFSLQVHSIEGLPSEFSNVSLCVHWKRRDGVLVTHPAKVFLGTAEFEEQLTHTCSVYGSRSGPHHSAKYEAKHFLLYASLYGALELDLGKHRIDLTRLLPLTLEELEEEKNTGKWTTSFKLSGKAKGAVMNVSFGYSVVGENSTAQGNIDGLKQNNRSVGKLEIKAGRGGIDGRMSIIQHFETLPSKSNHARTLESPRSVDDIKDLHEILPISRLDLCSSVDLLYQKLDEGHISSDVYKPELDLFSEHIEPIKPNLLPFSEIADNTSGDEFSITEKGVETTASEEEVKLEKGDVKAVDLSSVNHPDIVLDPALTVDCEEGTTRVEPQNKELDAKESLMEEIESALNSVSAMEKATPESPQQQEISKDATGNNLGLPSLDDDSVASEFLSMLGIEHSPLNLSSESEAESPRERLLRQFEESLPGGCSLFDSEIDIGGQETGASHGASSSPDWENLAAGFDLTSAIHEAEEYQIETKEVMSKMKAKMIEDLETEALMRDMGLNENAFQNSPPSNSSRFGSPIDLPNEPLPVQLPALGEGLGPFLQTKSGGFLRSMSPSIFSNAKSGGSLIMQVSSPVVVPAQMGSGIMEILQGLASVGMEKLSMQAGKLMPLEDITGKTMHQVAWESSATLEGPEREFILEHEALVGQDILTVPREVVNETSSRARSNKKRGSNSQLNELGTEYVSLEDLAPLAMDKIEALSMEGLRIQSGMSDEEAPSNISTQSFGEFSALQGKGVAHNISGSLGLDGAAGLQLLDVKDNGGDLDGLMGLSLTLDEWMRLDSGEIDDEDCISERTSKILAAHHAKSLNSFHGGGTKGEKRRGKGSSKKGGLLGNNFTVALMVQLRDPLRNYEPVGAPMLALIQVERVFIPPKPKIYSTVSGIQIRNEEEDETESLAVGEKETEEEVKGEKVKASKEEEIPKFRITEVHVAGIKDESGKKLWGAKTEQKSGSRWLLANGMGKSNKHPFMKSKKGGAKSSSVPETTKVQSGDTLWSISSRVHGDGAKWKELVDLNPHVRNPNVIFPNETIRLR